MKHHHSHIALLIFAFSVTLFVYALYGYMYNTIDKSLGRVLSAREDIKKEQLYSSQGKTLATLYDATARDRAKLATFFVSDSEKVSFIEMIESLGNHLGSTISLSSIVADDLATSPVGKLGHINMHVDVHGTWFAVIGTLISAENLPYKVNISNVRLDTSGALDAKNPRQTWKLSFVLDALSIRNPN